MWSAVSVLLISQRSQRSQFGEGGRRFWLGASLTATHNKGSRGAILTTKQLTKIYSGIEPSVIVIKKKELSVHRFLSFNIYMYKTAGMSVKIYDIQTMNLRLYTAAKLSTLFNSWTSEIPQKPLWPFSGELVWGGRVGVNWMVCSERLWVGFAWGYGHSPLGRWLDLAVYLGVSLPLPLNCLCSTWLLLITSIKVHLTFTGELLVVLTLKVCTND